ncbi:hypothetical protein Bbelb_204390 [Branchiostoma belcheri]|nr:hypothetical protein Bbelb_204390 [Branchiostoma belcheri]
MRELCVPMRELCVRRQSIDPACHHLAPAFHRTMSRAARIARHGRERSGRVGTALISRARNSFLGNDSELERILVVLPPPVRKCTDPSEGSGKYACSSVRNGASVEMAITMDQVKR